MIQNDDFVWLNAFRSNNFPNAPTEEDSYLPHHPFYIDVNPLKLKYLDSTLHYSIHYLLFQIKCTWGQSPENKNKLCNYTYGPGLLLHLNLNKTTFFFHFLCRFGYL